MTGTGERRRASGLLLPWEQSSGCPPTPTVHVHTPGAVMPFLQLLWPLKRECVQPRAWWSPLAAFQPPGRHRAEAGVQESR